ncbi:MAG: transposase, partial [Lachnospiraceae bacterium]
AQPWLRPIVSGTTKSPVEFGAKYDLSIDETGMGRIEKISYEAYNESTVLTEAIERYKERTGHYPERVLVDQIYRTRENRGFCKLHGIRLSGPKLGRPSLAKQSAKEKKQEYQDNTDRIEVERSFSLSKRCYGLGLIRTKLYDTTLTSIALCVFVTNLFKIQSRILFDLILLWKLITYRSAEIEPEMV